MENPKDKIDEAMIEELRKQGINPDVISDVDFEDGVDDYYDYTSDNYDEYGDDSYDY